MTKLLYGNFLRLAGLAAITLTVCELLFHFPVWVVGQLADAMRTELIFQAIAPGLYHPLLAGVFAIVGRELTEGGPRKKIRDIFIPVLRLLPKLMLTWVYVLVLGCLGFLVFVVGCFVVYVMYALVFQFLIFEGAGPLQSMRESRLLTKGSRWRLFWEMFKCTFLFGLPISLFFETFSVLNAHYHGPAYVSYLLRIFGAAGTVMAWSAVASKFYLGSVKQ